MSAWIFILLSSGCSLLIVNLLKITESRNLRTLNTLTVNYLAATVVAILLGYEEQALEWIMQPGPIWYFCIVVGALFIGNFLIYSKSVDLNGMGISVASMRLSLLVPVLISIVLYDEILSLPKIVGLMSVFTALGLLLPRRGRLRYRKIDAGWLLIALFTLSGLADASLKIYEEDFRDISEMIFMGGVFLTAALIGVMLSVFREGPLLTRKEFLVGTAIGIPNLYSSIFLIYALQSIDGTVAYPVVNILNVMGGTLLGLWIWNDTVSRLQWTGIGLAVISIILLL
ncbi:MAG: EamA family transporter [Balneolaceae bacterium]|nr:EamA family transporter [Balneolaceae bacterium]